MVAYSSPSCCAWGPSGFEFLKIRRRRFSLTAHDGFSDSRREWSFAMPRAGCPFLRDATAALRSSSGGEMVDSEIVDI